MKKINLSPFILGVAWFLLPLSSQAEWFSAEEAIMGTAVRVEVWHDDRSAGQAAIAAVMREMRRIDALMSTYKDDSELSRINRLAAKQALVVNQELFNLIDRSLDFSKKTAGAFDITYSGVGRLYDYRNKKKPADKDIEKTLPLINYRHVILDRSAKTIKFARPGVRIDLGGIAKGYAVDTSIDLLKARGITSALVTAGGDSRLLGSKQGRPWMIGIRDPRNKEGMIAVLPLKDEAISTSGDYERYFEKDGVRYHHIINPTTGRSAAKARSATVIGPDATTTDALSTSIFILGPKEGLALIESLPGIEAVIIDPSGKMHFSSGLENPSSPSPRK